MICLKKSRCFQNKKSNKRKLSFWLFYLNNFFLFLLSTIFVFVRCLWRNKHKRCVCMFVCFDVHTALNQRFPSVLCVHIRFFRFFFVCCVVPVCICICTYNWKCTRANKRERKWRWNRIYRLLSQGLFRFVCIRVFPSLSYLAWLRRCRHHHHLYIIQKTKRNELHRSSAISFRLSYQTSVFTEGFKYIK